jgi:hypothetical protein
MLYFWYPFTLYVIKGCWCRDREAQKENMLCLLGLLDSQVNPDYLEIAELHRELGDFKIAFDVIATKYQENERQKEVGDTIANLIFYKQNQPRIAKMNV